MCLYHAEENRVGVNHTMLYGHLLAVLYYWDPHLRKHEPRVRVYKVGKFEFKRNHSHCLEQKVRTSHGFHIRPVPRSAPAFQNFKSFTGSQAVLH